MNRKTWIVGLALVAIAATYVIFFRKTEEDRIREKLRALAEAIGKSEGENEMLRAMRVEKAFGRIFMRDVDLQISETREGKHPRHELATLTVGAGHVASKISLRYESVRIEVDRPVSSTSHGWVTGTAIITASRNAGGGDSETREVVIRFDREEEEWRIASVSTKGGDR